MKAPVIFMIAATIGIIACDSAPLIRQIDRPGATTITALRRELNVAPFESCSFETDKLALDSTAFLGPDSLVLRLPPGWRESSRGVEEFHHDSIVKFMVADQSSRIDVIRMPYVRRVSMSTYYVGDSSGLIPPKRMTEVPLEGRCEMTDAEAGALWSFHLFPASNATSGQTYQGVGDVITSRGKRYQITIASPSKAERENLARIISDAVIAQ